jgi:hypothetical protein
MIVVTVAAVQAQHAEQVDVDRAEPLWQRTPAFIDRWRAAIVASPAFTRSSTAPTWIGLAIAGLGFAVIAYGWGRIGGLSAVALQLPYLISAGCGGLGLVVAGSTIVALQAKRRDAAAREQVIAELGRVVRELERVAGERAHGGER